MEMLIIPKGSDFQRIKGKIEDGVQLRCGCQCHCPGGGQRCSGTCANCKKLVDGQYIKAHSRPVN